ncbi:MAG: hypothetical protein P4M11_13880 [Candidatus Pacebacteria bacterium]|nr:hypothetical protein [Candidatus Paceibacterota bacterium]
MFGIQIRDKVTANAKELLRQITERMQHVYYVRQRETIAERTGVGRLTDEVERLRKQLAISTIRPSPTPGRGEAGGGCEAED